MAKLYSNENFPIPTVEKLRDLGHDVVTIQEIGRANESASDEEVLAFGIAQGRIVLTINRKHFYRLHEKNNKHSGIIACVVELGFQKQAKMIHEAIIATGDLAGKIIRVPPRA